MEDFAHHTSTWVDPVSTDYRGNRVWEIPPPGQGISVADAECAGSVRSEIHRPGIGRLVAPVH